MEEAKPKERSVLWGLGMTPPVLSWSSGLCCRDFPFTWPLQLSSGKRVMDVLSLPLVQEQTMHLQTSPREGRMNMTWVVFWDGPLEKAASQQGCPGAKG